MACSKEDEMKKEPIIWKIEKALVYFGLLMFVMWVLMEDFTYLGLVAAAIGPVLLWEGRKG